MGMMPTKAAEEIYSVLQRYAEASPRYYDSEMFIYNFGVVPTGSKKFRLNCMDGKMRKFIKDGDDYRLEGHGHDKVNAIVKKILSDTTESAQIEDFKVSEV